MITLAQITNTEVFAFLAAQGFKLLNCKVLFINREDNIKCKKVVCFLKNSKFHG